MDWGIPTMAKRAAKPKQLPDQLRDAIRASGMSIYRVAKASGISWPVVGRFMSGERDLRFETAGKIAAALGLELRSKDTE
jgi:DNA-binding phage protein